MADRDRDLERRLLERAGAGPEFTEEVLGRLDHYESLHGNTGWDREVDALLQEAQEECADIAGWAAGAALQLEAHQILQLTEAIALGAAAHRKLAFLREHIALAR